MSKLEQLKKKWSNEGITKNSAINRNAIEIFERDNSIILPNDLKEYFKLLNGTFNQSTDELYEFYSIENVRKVSDEFSDWQGIPNYRLLLNLEKIKDLFVFANYSFNLFSYAIRLSSEQLDENEIYVLCGGNYKKIANNFFDFLDLYIDNSIELQLNEV
ncbi:SMI1/KNR4 family protein [Chryseobacterium sp. MYb264]|uniref:SMI1/KNR4 family protein n=1 Tax=Chryseobacterium sp. MYb264 TaxID=2745153 RepID=UPI002E11BF51|nr:SMI1/KNR4 family protein [Chryseobacterium sp. MYb264]